MLQVSNEFKELMKERTDFKEYAEITLADGTKFAIDENDFTIQNNVISDGIGSSEFPIGVALQKNIQIQFLNYGDKYSEYDFTNAKIVLYVAFQLSQSVEKIKKGEYTVVSPASYGSVISILAYDDMYKADKQYTTDLEFPQTIGNMLSDICETIGCSLKSSTFLHSDFVVANKPSGTFREVIGEIAMIACGNARFDVNNKLCIMTYDFSGFDTGDYHQLSGFQTPKIDQGDVVITGVRMSVKSQDASLLYGSDVYSIVLENELAAGNEETVVQWIGDSLIDKSFRPFSGDHIANPLVEFMDLAKVTDRKGNEYNTFITDAYFTYCGFTDIRNTVPSMGKFARQYYSETDNLKKEMQYLLSQERIEREKELSDFSNTITKDINNLQDQIDGAIETYFYDHLPYDDNEPAINWDTDEEKNKHLGDLFYVVDNEDYGGQAYRYALIDGVYIWDYVEDTAVTKALATASKAQDTADSKRRIFIEQPVPPYDIGDTWMNGDDILSCTSGRESGTFLESDWSKLNSYTDDTKANEALNVANGAQNTASGKNTIFYQDTAPDLDGRKVNDIWFDTSNGNTMYYFDGENWTKKIFKSMAIDVSDIFAQNIVATGTIAGAILTGAEVHAKKMDVSEEYKPFADSENYEFVIKRGTRRVQIPLENEDVYLGASDTILIGAYNPNALVYDDWGSIAGIAENSGGVVEFSPDGLYLNGENFSGIKSYVVGSISATLTSTTYYKSGSIICAKEGYKAIGIIGHKLTNGANYSFPNLYVSNNAIYYTIVETNKVTWSTSLTPTFYILYEKIRA